MSTDKKLVVWECMSCKHTFSGFLSPLASSVRFHCEALCKVVHDEREPADRDSEMSEEDQHLYRIIIACSEASSKAKNRSATASDIVKSLGIALRGIKKAK